MDISLVPMDIPEGCNIILGQTHFIKTAEDLYEILANADSAMRNSALHLLKHPDPA